MLFNSFAFVAFIVVVLVVYWALRSVRLQNTFLLAASLFFYGFGGPRFLALILTCAGSAYLAGLWIDARPASSRHALDLDAVVPLAVLFVFKYLDFFFDTVDSTLDARRTGPAGF